MKKFCVLIFTILLTAGILAGCGAQSGEAAPSEAPTAPEAPSKSEGPSGDGGFYENGDLASDFELPASSGGSIKLSELRGKPTVLNFWATWCGYCCEELPDFERIKEDYDGKANVLTVNVGESPDTVSAFLSENEYTFLTALDEEGKINYPTNIIPYTLVLDGDGRVVFSKLGGARDGMYDIIAAVLDDLM